MGTRKPTRSKQPAPKRKRTVAARPRFEEGAFVRIPLEDGTFAYGRDLAPPYFAFYNLRTAEPVSDLDEIESKPILFKTGTRVDRRRWIPLGTRELRGAVAEPVVMFHQAMGDYRRCTIVDSTGNSRRATPEECVGLERESVWETHGIERRLLDTFEGRPNRAVEHGRVLLEPDRDEMRRRDRENARP